MSRQSKPEVGHKVLESEWLFLCIGLSGVRKLTEGMKEVEMPVSLIELRLAHC